MWDIGVLSSPATTLLISTLKLVEFPITISILWIPFSSVVIGFKVTPKSLSGTSVCCPFSFSFNTQDFIILSFPEFESCAFNFILEFPKIFTYGVSVLPLAPFVYSSEIVYSIVVFSFTLSSINSKDVFPSI